MKTPTVIPFATIFSSLLTNAFYIDRSDTSLNVVHFPIEKRFVSRDAIDQRDTSAISRRSLLTRLKNGVR